MPSHDELELMAAAIYEIRLLLSDYLGGENDSESCIRLAAHLSYALHDDALKILEGRGAIDTAAARIRIRQAESVVGETFADNGNFLRSQTR